MSAWLGYATQRVNETLSQVLPGRRLIDVVHLYHQLILSNGGGPGESEGASSNQLKASRSWAESFPLKEGEILPRQPSEFPAFPPALQISALAVSNLT